MLPFKMPFKVALQSKLAFLKPVALSEEVLVSVDS